MSLLERLAWWGALLCVSIAGLILFGVAYVRSLVQVHRQRRLCKAGACDYYTDYLQKGAAHLDHRTYHVKRDALGYWMGSAEQWEQSDRGCPQYVNTMVELYRIETRR